MRNLAGQAGITEKRDYFLARCFGFASDATRGSGGVANILRSNASVRFLPSATGSNSIDLSSAACCAALGLGLFMLFFRFNGVQ